MAGENNLLDNIRDITNPTITTVVEFDSKSLLNLGAVLLAVIVIAILAWAIARKASR